MGRRPESETVEGVGSGCRTVLHSRFCVNVVDIVSDSFVGTLLLLFDLPPSSVRQALTVVLLFSTVPPGFKRSGFRIDPHYHGSFTNQRDSCMNFSPRKRKFHSTATVPTILVLLCGDLLSHFCPGTLESHPPVSDHINFFY